MRGEASRVVILRTWDAAVLRQYGFDAWTLIPEAVQRLLAVALAEEVGSGDLAASAIGCAERTRPDTYYR